MVRFVIKKGNEDLTDSKEIRRKVFIEEQKVPEELEYDEYDISSMHLIAYEGEKAVATSRLAFVEGHYKIGRVAVLKEERGKRYGDYVVRAMLGKAFEDGIEEVYVGAQIQARGFYETIGFKAINEEIYDEAGIPHVMMKIVKEDFGGIN